MNKSHERTHESPQSARERLSIAQRIKARRNELRSRRGSYTQDYVAGRLSDLRGLPISQPAYGKYETGKNEPSPSDLVFIAEILEVPVSYFFGEETIEDVNRAEEIIMFQGLHGDFRAKAGDGIRQMVELQKKYADNDRSLTTHGKPAA